MSDRYPYFRINNDCPMAYELRWQNNPPRIQMFLHNEFWPIVINGLIKAREEGTFAQFKIDAPDIWPMVLQADSLWYKKIGFGGSLLRTWLPANHPYSLWEYHLTPVIRQIREKQDNDRSINFIATISHICKTISTASVGVANPDLQLMTLEIGIGCENGRAYVAGHFSPCLVFWIKQILTKRHDLVRELNQTLTDAWSKLRPNYKETDPAVGVNVGNGFRITVPGNAAGIGTLSHCLPKGREYWGIETFNMDGKDQQIAVLAVLANLNGLVRVNP